MTFKRTFHQLGRCTYDVNTKWVGRKQYVIHVDGVGDTWYLGSKRPTFSQIEYKVIELLEQKGILKKNQINHFHSWKNNNCFDKIGRLVCRKGI